MLPDPAGMLTVSGFAATLALEVTSEYKRYESMMQVKQCIVHLRPPQLAYTLLSPRVWQSLGDHARQLNGLAWLAQMAQAQAYATYLVELAMLDYSMLVLHLQHGGGRPQWCAANRLLGREDDCPAGAAEALRLCARRAAALRPRPRPAALQVRLPPLLHCSAASHCPLVRHTCWDGGRQYSSPGRLTYMVTAAMIRHSEGRKELAVVLVQLHSVSNICLC